MKQPAGEERAARPTVPPLADGLSARIQARHARPDMQRRRARVALARELLINGHSREEVKDVLIAEFGIGRAMAYADIGKAGGARRPGVEAKDGAEPLLRAREELGLSRRGLDLAAGIAEGTVSALEGIWGHRIGYDVALRIATALQERADEQQAECDCALDSLFTRDRCSSDLVGTRIRPPTPPAERPTSSLADWTKEQLNKLEELGYHTAHHLQRDHHVSLRTAQEWLRDGRLKPLPLEELPAEVREIAYGLHVAYVVPVRASKFFARDLYEKRESDYRLGLQLGGRITTKDGQEVTYFEWARELTGDRQDAKALDSRRAARLRAYSSVRVGTGRRPRAERPSHHAEWLTLFESFRQELESEYREAVRLDLPHDGPATNWQIALAVAEADCATHPERWETYVARDGNIQRQLERAAADRVLKALKRLQNAQTETRLG